MKWLFKQLSVIFAGLWVIGFTANWLLILYVEWILIRDNFLQFINPLLHVEAFFALVQIPLFWILLVVTGISYAGASAFEKLSEDNGENKSPTTQPNPSLPKTPLLIFVVLVLAIVGIFISQLPPTRIATSTIVPPTSKSISAASATLSKILSTPTKRPSSPTPNNPLKQNGCIKWSDVQKKHIGKTICVYGIVNAVASNADTYTISFSDEWHDFKVQDWNYNTYFPPIESGVCIVANGDVVDNVSFLILIPDIEEGAMSTYSDTRSCR